MAAWIQFWTEKWLAFAAGLDPDAIALCSILLAFAGKEGDRSGFEIRRSKLDRMVPWHGSLVSAVQELKEAGVEIEWRDNGGAIWVRFSTLGRLHEDREAWAERQRRKRSCHANVTRDVTLDVTRDVTTPVTPMSRVKPEAISQITDKQRTDTPPPEAGPPLRAQAVSAADVQETFEAYRKHQPRAKIGAKARRLIQERLREGYTVQDLTEAIDAHQASPWHRGANDRNRPYLTLELCVRDSEHVAQFLEMARVGKGRPVLSDKGWRQARVLHDWIEKTAEEPAPTHPNGATP